ncbi:MAG: hypothetical protein KGZ60_10755 [Truepera sp.]|nr:hypothetical protein [Truepera sp.]
MPRPLQLRHYRYTALTSFGPHFVRAGAALRAAYHPVTFIGLLILLVGVVNLCSVPPRQRVERATVTLETIALADEPPVELEVVLVGDAGATNTRLVELPASPDAALRLTGLLAALREVMREDGRWPPELPAPQLFLLERRGVTVAVLNFSLAQRPTVTISQEHQLYASLAATLQRHGVGEMRILINGHPSPVFINHLALRRSLD